MMAASLAVLIGADVDSHHGYKRLIKVGRLTKFHLFLNILKLPPGNRMRRWDTS